jgi:hypothetical protein
MNKPWHKHLTYSVLAIHSNISLFSAAQLTGFGLCQVRTEADWVEDLLKLEAVDAFGAVWQEPVSFVLICSRKVDKRP